MADKDKESEQDRIAAAKKAAEDKIEGERLAREQQATSLAAQGKKTTPKVAPITNGNYQDDVLRRVNRRDQEIVKETKSVEVHGNVITVKMPNGLKVRITVADGPVPETIKREDIIRWDNVA